MTRPPLRPRRPRPRRHPTGLADLLGQAFFTGATIRARIRARVKITAIANDEAAAAATAATSPPASHRPSRSARTGLLHRGDYQGEDQGEGEDHSHRQ